MISHPVWVPLPRFMMIKRITFICVVSVIVLIYGGCNNTSGDSAIEPSVSIEVERPTSNGGKSNVGSGVTETKTVPVGEPSAVPTPRDRISILLTPVASPTIPAAFEGRYGRPVTTPVPQAKLEPEFKDHYRQGERYLTEGKKYWEQEDYEAADNAFRSAAGAFSEAINIRPKITESYTSRGTAYMELGEWKKAISDFDAALDLNHTLVSPFAGRAIVYRLMGNKEEAKKNIDAAIFNGIDRNILEQYMDGTVKRLKTRY